uniref:Uncharacterized protein n=1 Tax=Rhizophora mucronata TaxID=61149 RepID=A0A2P2MZ17_RHIMU
MYSHFDMDPRNLASQLFAIISFVMTELQVDHSNFKEI